MRDVFVERLDRVASELAWLDEELMFFGAGIITVFLDFQSNPLLARELRPTEDVDAMVHVETGAHGPSGRVNAIESELRHHGWRSDLRPHRRNIHAYESPSGVAVDFVFDVLYPADDWAVVAQQTTRPVALPSGAVVQVPSPAMFLVCKIAASRTKERWAGPYYSHDLEDVALLMAGCSELDASLELLGAEAREYLSRWATEVATRETAYGRRAYACLEGNWPRSVATNLDALLARAIHLSARRESASEGTCLE